ncbi:MAG: L-seryl-tRNA(Sec) selenium transferase [Phycisphaerae bacterium]
MPRPTHKTGTTTHSNTDLFTRIPSMTVLLQAAESDANLCHQPQAVVAAALRETVAILRERIQAGRADETDCMTEAVLARTCGVLKTRGADRLRQVINATGVILHTGLGRSVLPMAAVERIGQVAAGYCSLEIDLLTGKRGRRGAYVERLLRELTGAEAAMIVNNNAAATMLALRGLAGGREVIVSRGQLIEIGGSFRLPEVMTAGGAVLREVGTTNKTHLRDYAAAIGPDTAMIMHVHTSNYRVVGFSECPAPEELVKLAHEHGLLMFDDLGSGALLDDDLWKAAKEPTVAESRRAGADVVSFSGDKLLGGPQAGILLGKRETIDQLRGDPMARALRVDKLTLAALEAVLALYHDPDRAKQEIPILASLSESMSSLEARAETLAEQLRAARPSDAFTVKQDESFAGGGSLPAWPFPTAIVCWQPAGGLSINEIARHLRLRDPAILCRIKEGAIYFDLRTITKGEYDSIATGIVAVCKAG